MKNAIELKNISKQYRLGLVSSGTFSHDINRWWHRMRGHDDPYLKIGETNERNIKGNSEYVWALKDINFSVKEGEVLGIIGKNGAGKSTLLKILSRVTGPTTGTIRYKGRIGSLLEVGTGFHPELTGRENIFINGAILGMTKDEINHKLEEIVDFSGCVRYIDTPVKRYSSGMMVRLGFAVAAHLEPEILVVDEVLAVGDAEFQKKAIGKMQDVSKNQGTTVLFVSHNMRSIQQLCNKGIILKEGKISNYGDIEDIVQSYLYVYNKKEVTSWKNSNQHQKLDDIVTFHEFSLKTQDGSDLNKTISINTKLYVSIKFYLAQIDKDLLIGFSLFDELGNLLYRTLHTDTDNSINSKLQIGKNCLECEIYVEALKPGKYKIVLDVSIYNIRRICNPFEEDDKVLTFNVENLSFTPNWHKHGLISPIIKWNISSPAFNDVPKKNTNILVT